MPHFSDYIGLDSYSYLDRYNISYNLLRFDWNLYDNDSLASSVNKATGLNKWLPDQIILGDY